MQESSMNKKKSSLPQVEKCVGCGSCVSICPQGVLSLANNEKGFLHPIVSLDKCSGCNFCSAHCPALVSTCQIPAGISEVYSAWSLDENTRARSSSGGIFSEIAKNILSSGGVVAGVTFCDDFSLKHMLIENEEKIDLLRQSKYTQSNMSEIYKQIYAALNLGKKVFFTGTPCQCDAVKAYLKKPYDNLILCDLICRGVNSNYVFQEYLNWLQNKFNSTIVKIRVREKDDGWLNWGIRIIFKNGEEYFSHHKSDPFIIGFLNGLFLRDSCYHCQYKGKSRFVDITLGDFWGIQLDDMSQLEKGVSAVILHSAKGKELLNAVSKNIFFENRSIHDIIIKNPMLIKSAEKGNQRDKFFSLFRQIDFETLMSNIIISSAKS